MRRIEKNEPTWFAQFLKHKILRDWDNDMPNDKKREVRNYILENEQDFYSAYTEKLLSLDDAGTHIDHFRKQSLFSSLHFNWSNLFVDKHMGEYGADYKDSKKSPVRNTADYKRIIDPQAEDPHHYFRYMANGDIASRENLNEFDKEKAEFTIKAFNLCHPSLSQERYSVILKIKSLKSGGIAANDIKCYLEKTNFPSLIEYFCDEVFDLL